jgi:hypothetical protein
MQKPGVSQQPFLKLRQDLYLEAIKAAGVLATKPKEDKEYKAAQERFRQLYVAELSMVESSDVAGRMVDLAPAVAPELRNLNEAQHAALNLAHALRDSLRESWGRDTLPQQTDTTPKTAPQ